MIELPTVELDEAGRHYIHEGKTYTRVTDIIHKTLPPYLAPWAEGVGQQAALEVISRNGLPGSLDVLKQWIGEAGLTCDDEKDAGGDRGSALHLSIEALIRGQETTLNLDDFDNPEHRLYAQAFAAFMVDYQPVFEEAEVRVFHPELGYAGTFDCVATITARPKGARGPDVTGKRLILDWKTNKECKVYPQHLWQLAAYELACEYHGIEVDGSMVVSLGPMGQTKKKTPYTARVNYVQPQAFAGVMAFYNLVEEQNKLNPLGRK